MNLFHRPVSAIATAPLSAVELRTQPVEAFLGAPAGPDAGPAQLRRWRETIPVDRAREFRKKYDDAGVLIEIVKVDGLFKMSEAELDYAFTLAKTLGARAISTEISKSDDTTSASAGLPTSTS